MSLRQPRFMDLNAAADFLGPGAIEVNDYQSEITDIVRRRGELGQRIRNVPATGHPSRYFEQTAIVAGAFQDPRSLSPSPTTPTRLERSLLLKAVIAQINFSQFDIEVTQQQGQFAFLRAKDLLDSVDGVMLTHDKNLWNGSDTSLTAATTLEYVGLLTQITQTSTIAVGASIIDGIKAQVAAMFANATFQVRPTAIYINPILGDLLDREAKALNMTFSEVEVVAGVRVKAIQTQAGLLPIIPDPTLPSTVVGSITNYKAVIVTEPMVEYHYLTNPMPRVFQLGLVGNLAAQEVIVKYGAPVAKGPSYAHTVVTVQR